MLFAAMVDIGFEEQSYSVVEGQDVEVCAVILSGTLRRRVGLYYHIETEREFVGNHIS